MGLKIYIKSKVEINIDALWIVGTKYEVNDNNNTVCNKTKR